MRTISVAFGLVFVVAAASGCLRKEVVHTIYLGPSDVVWAVTESGVRSDEQSAADRRREEYGYAVAANAGVHPMAEAFHRLGAQAVTTTWLRRERPYAVMTEARFGDVRQLALALLESLGTHGDVALRHEGCRTRLDARIDVDASAEGTEDNPVQELLTELRSYRLRLTEGRFVAADGFEIQEDGASAMPVSKNPGADGNVVLSLTWNDESCSSR